MKDSKMKDRLKKVTLKGWIAAAAWGTLYVAFVIWLAWDDPKSLGWIVLLPVVLDIFTTKYIPWSWWKKYKDTTPLAYSICSWVDAILFALVAVYFINLYAFQNYQIPSSSLEKTLRVGDFLYVDKMGYGARVPMTPLSMPLMQHTAPAWLGSWKSYLDKPHWEYKRLRGWTEVKKGDIVVFNFPAGDTVCTKMQNPDYYTLCHYYGKGMVERRKDVFGEIVTRPIDRRENYVKRCVGTPGDSLQIMDNVVWVNGIAEPNREGRQFNYLVQTDGHVLGQSYLAKIGISKEDRESNGNGLYHLPLTQAMKAELEKNTHVVSIQIEPEQYGGDVYPLGHTDWTRDNYGPIYIPAKGDSLLITEENYYLYKRIADAYEFRPMRMGEYYTFQMNYYWMMGDNRHKSADSRFWGFVPEDHIVGRPMFVWLSMEKDNAWGRGHIRWKRIGLKAKE